MIRILFRGQGNKVCGSLQDGCLLEGYGGQGKQFACQMQ